MLKPTMTDNEIGEYQAEVGEIPGSLDILKQELYCPFSLYIQRDECQEANWDKYRRDIYD